MIHRDSSTDMQLRHMAEEGQVLGCTAPTIQPYETAAAAIVAAATVASAAAAAADVDDIFKIVQRVFHMLIARIFYEAGL